MWWNFSITAATAKHRSLNDNRTKIRLLRKSIPGNRLTLSNVLWDFAGTSKSTQTFLDLHMLKHHDGVCNLLCDCYFLLLLCFLDAHYVLFNLIVIKFSKFGFHCSLLSSNSKQFNAIFWLAGKCGTLLFNNKLVSTWLSSKTSFFKNVWRSSFVSWFDNGFSKVHNDSNLQKLWALWSMVLIELSYRKLCKPYLLLPLITHINTQHNFILTAIGVSSLEIKNPLPNKRSAWKVSINLSYLSNGISGLFTSQADSSGNSLMVHEVAFT